ncbi:MAG TPA: TatD family hydrolase [Prosthecobacter sp.]
MIDSHCHIDLYKDPLSVAREAEKCKIHTVAVTHLPSHYRQAKTHLAGFSFVRPALGLHPLVAHKHKGELGMFEEFCKEAEFIGEIGLDFSSGGRASRDQQEHSFDFALNCISKKRKFVTLHSRGAENEVLDRLHHYSVSNAVFHYFSGSRTQLLRLLDQGHYISINTAMIRTAKWQGFIELVPLSRILTETDGPFVKCGAGPSRPQDVIEVYRWLGIKLSKPLQGVIDQIDRNFRSIAFCGGKQTGEPSHE